MTDKQGCPSDAGPVRRVIPIVADTRWIAPQGLGDREPQLDGDERVLKPLVAAVARELSSPGGPLEGRRTLGSWLRAFRVRDGEAEMRLASELGSCGTIVAARAFNILRHRLHDTDIVVFVERRVPRAEGPLR